jgi:hypothetical protein
MNYHQLPDLYVDAIPRVVDQVTTEIDRGEVYRYLGYPAGQIPKRSMQSIIDEWIDTAATLAMPRAVYLVLPVEEISARKVKLRLPRQSVVFRGAIGEFLGPSQFIAPFIATAGAAVEALASERLKCGDALASLVVNAVGAERAEAAESAVLDELRHHFVPTGIAATLPYSPGYCGMALTEQRQLFSLFSGQTAGVVLTEECLMQPLKSVSGLIGLGPAELVQVHGVPCDRCELYNCAMRRTSHDGDK